MLYVCRQINEPFSICRTRLWEDFALKREEDLSQTCKPFDPA